MDVSPLAIAKVLVPELPNIIRVAFLAIFHLSAASPLQDPLTQILVSVIRPVLATPASIALSQRQTSHDLPVRGPIWVSKVTLPGPEDGDIRFRTKETRVDSGFAEMEADVKEEKVMGVMEAIRAAFEVLGDGTETFTEPEIADVEAEWNAYRCKARWWTGRPECDEGEMYERMMHDVGDDGPTILYFHGGAFVLMDPSTHRIFTTRLAYLTRGRCLSIRFRMAPEYPFPTSLLDCLIAYLTLISPSSSSYHSPTPAFKIVFAGDSSGAALATSLTLLLLTLKNTLNVTHLRFNNANIPISLPAGLASLHPYLDIARSLPSIHRNTIYDIITPPSTWPSPLFPADRLWPSSPPRIETYCDAVSVIHPLVSAVAAPTHLWRGCPPVYVAVGYEGLQDEISVFARRVYEADPGNIVYFDGYVGQPHCFAFLTPWTRASRRCFDNWAAFCHGVVQPQSTIKLNDFDDENDLISTSSSSSTSPIATAAELSSPIKRTSTAKWTTHTLTTTTTPLSTLALTQESSSSANRLNCDDDTVRRLLQEQKAWRVQLEEKVLEEWREIVGAGDAAHNDREGGDVDGEGDSNGHYTGNVLRKEGRRIRRRTRKEKGYENYSLEVRERVRKWWNMVGKEGGGGRGSRGERRGGGGGVGG